MIVQDKFKDILVSYTNECIETVLRNDEIISISKILDTIKTYQILNLTYFRYRIIIIYNKVDNYLITLIKISLKV